nr:retrovirus-related Pol polyprotein from transposon TNT 1-94 [Tanacetum cinerariifolium]
MYRESNLKCIKTLDKELETLKQEKDVVDGKLARLLKSSKDLESLIEITDYSRPAPTIESTSEEGQDKNSSTSEGVALPITPKPFIKSVKPKDCQSERQLRDIIGRYREDKKKQRNKKSEDSEAEHQRLLSATTTLSNKAEDPYLRIFNIFIHMNLLKAQGAIPIPTGPSLSIPSMASLPPQDRWSKDKHIELVNIIGNPEARMLTRVMAKELSVALAHECLFVDFLS